MNRRANKTKAKNEARNLVNTFGFTKPPLDLHSLLSFIDLESKGFNPETLEFKNADKISAFIEYSENIIFYNETHSKNRVRFSIAHEIGHYQLNHKSFPHPVKYDSKDVIEIEANTFASELLMPKALIDKESISSRDDIKRIANKYNVSEKAVELRVSYDTSLVTSGYDHLNTGINKKLTEEDLNSCFIDAHFPPPISELACKDSIIEYYSQFDIGDLEAILSGVKQRGEEDEYPEIFQVVLELIDEIKLDLN